MDAAPRVALIHALMHSVAPINAEFERAWPECVRMNLLDDSLSHGSPPSRSGPSSSTPEEAVTRLNDLR